MPDAQGEPTQEEAVDAIYGYAVQQMQAGVKGRALIDDLVEQGLDRESATIVVENLNQAKAKAVRSAGIKHMVIGGIIGAIGIGVTVGTYNAAASSGGGSYTVAYGAIAVGAIEFLIGLFQVLTGRGE